MKLTNPNQTLVLNALSLRAVKVLQSKQNHQKARRDTLGKLLHKLSLKRPLVFSALAAATLSGCQTMSQPSAPVIPREDATFDTTGFGETKNTAVSEAMNNANITCKQYPGTRVVVTKDEVKYNGIVDEKTGALIDKAGQVIGILAGQEMPKAASETDYEAQITFKCMK